MTPTTDYAKRISHINNFEWLKNSLSQVMYCIKDVLNLHLWGIWMHACIHVDKHAFITLLS